MRRSSASFLLLASILVCTPRLALADEPTPADKETARALLIDGRAKLKAHDLQGALRALKGAHDIMHVPTTGADYAAALEATGQLVEARNVALEVTRFPEKPGEPPAFHDYRIAAAELAAKLEARIPAVVINVKGVAPGVTPTVAIDGTPLPAAILGLPRKVNPGLHKLTATAPGYLAYEKKLTLAESTPPVTFDIVLALDPTPRVVAPAGPRPVPAWAWASLAIGVVGLGVGAGFGADYASVKSSVTSDCPNDACTPTNFAAASALKSSWNRDLGVMGAGLGVGVVGVVTGLVGIVGARRGAPPAQTGAISLTPMFTPGSRGLSATGAF
jgi:hypothetical protein